LQIERVSLKPTLYIDLEGVSLCHEGSISILTLLVKWGSSSSLTVLYDVHLLGSSTFATTGTKSGKTLKDILQDESILKVFLDVRNDSGALFALYGVALQGIEDVQLMESATRETTSSRKYLNGLAKCIENNFVWSGSNYNSKTWKRAKETGEKLFKSEHGGSYQVFNQRPIPDAIKAYCVGDVQCLPGLHAKFSRKPNHWKTLVNEETKTRIAGTHKPDYKPCGRERALTPWSNEQNKILDQWNYVPSYEDCDFDDFDDFDDLDDWYRGDNYDENDDYYYD
jgi:exonuclease 3'-5' domain-containing protein 1